MNGRVARIRNATPTWAVLLLALAGCTSPTEPASCATRWSDVAWTALGPESTEVRAVVQSPAAVFAATGEQRVLALPEGAGAWEQRGLVGQDLTHLVGAGPSQRLLAGVSPAPDTALFATSDGGASWHPGDRGFPYNKDGPDFVASLLADTIHRQLVLVGTSAGLLQSTDAGASWNWSWEGITPRILAYTPAGGGVVLAGYSATSGKALLSRSIDGGETWAIVGAWQSGLLGMPLAFAVDRQNPNILYMGGGGGPALRRWSTAGEFWDSLAAFPDLIPVALQATGDEIVGVYTTIGGPSSVQISCDGALTWRSFPAPVQMGQALSSANSAEGSILIGTKTSGVWKVEPVGG